MSVALLAAVPPATAQVDKRPTAEELHEAYPLGPPRARSPSGPGRAPQREARPAETSSSATTDDGPAASTALLVLVLLGVVAIAAFVAEPRLRGRRRLPVPFHGDRADDLSALLLLAPPRAAAARRAGDGAAPPDPTRAWSAETRWRQDGSARFEVVAAASDGDRRTMVTSAPVTWPPEGPDDVQRLNDVISRLEAGFVGAGWVALPPGDAWYAKRFAWAARPGAYQVRSSEHRVGPRLATVPDPPADREAPPSEPAKVAGRLVGGRRWPEGSEELWRCEIRWDAGYRTSRFVGFARAPGARRSARVGESPAFAWMLMDPPDSESPLFRAAVQALAIALEDAGWDRISPGVAWWEQRFVWRQDGEPASRVEASPVGLEV